MQNAIEDQMMPRHPFESRPLTSDELALVRHTRDSALEEAAMVIELQHGEWRLAAQLRPRKSSAFVQPTEPRVLNAVGRANEPRFW